MGSVLLISTQPFKYDELESVYKDFGEIFRRSRLSDAEKGDYWYPELTVQGDWGWFRFDDYDPIEEVYYEILRDDGGAEELAKVKALGDKPYFMVLEFSDRESGEMALLKFPDKGITLVDNEDNMIFPIEETRQRIRSGKQWEYTRDRQN